MATISNSEHSSCIHTMSHRSGPVSDRELDDLGDYLFDNPLANLMRRVTGRNKQKSSPVSSSNNIPVNNGGNSEELYQKGLRLKRRDPSSAAHMVLSAANSGLPQAMNTIGEFYAEGIGVPKDAASATSWWERGIASGSADAMANLGICYVEGNGVPQDYYKGVELFRRAAGENAEHGFKGLSLCYKYGVGVQQDEAEAQRLRAKADEVGKLKKEASRPPRARRSGRRRSSKTHSGGSTMIARPGSTTLEHPGTTNGHSDSTQMAESLLSKLQHPSHYESRKFDTLHNDLKQLEILTRTSLEVRMHILQHHKYAGLIRTLLAFQSSTRVAEVGIHLLRNLIRGVPNTSQDLLAYLLAKEESTNENFWKAQGPFNGANTSTSPIRFVVLALQTHTSQQSLQAVGCSTLAAFCTVSPAIQSNVCEHGGVKAIIAAMDSHRSSALVQEMGARALFDVCTGTKSLRLRQVVGDQGGITSLVRTIRHFSNAATDSNAAVVEQSCAALRNICSECDSNSVLALQNDIVAVLFGAIRKSLRHEAIVGWALAALSTLKGCGELLYRAGAIDVGRTVLENWVQVKGIAIRVLSFLALIASAGNSVQHQVGREFLNVVVEIMQAYSDDVKVLEYGCDCLSEMCLRDRDNQQIAADCSACPVVVDAFVRYNDNVSVVETACAALYAMVDENESCRDQVVACGGLKPIVDGLRRFEHKSDSLVEAAAAALRVLGEGDDCRFQLNDLKGVDLLADAMKSYPESAGVQEQCAGGIAVLARDNEVLKARLAEGGAVSTLLHSTENFIEDSFVVEQCCAAIQCLASKNAGISIMFVTRGVSEVFARVIRRYIDDLPDKGPLLEAACDTLCVLGSEHVSHKDIIGEEGAVEALVDTVIRTTQKDEKVLMSALSALSTLTLDSKPNRDRLGLCGGISAIVEPLKTMEDSPRVAELCCLALCNGLRRHDRNREDLLQAKGVDAILRAMEQFRGDEALVEQACWALAVACVNNQQLQRRIAKGSGISLVLDVMKNFQRSSVVQAAACALLFSCAVANKANQRRIVLQNGRSYIVQALQQHQRSRKVNLYATHALRVTEDVQSEDNSTKSEDIVRAQSYTHPETQPAEGETEPSHDAQSDDPSSRRTSLWRRRTKSSPVADPQSKWNTVRQRLRSFTLIGKSFRGKPSSETHSSDRAIQAIQGPNDEQVSEDVGAGDDNAP